MEAAGGRSRSIFLLCAQRRGQGDRRRWVCFPEGSRTLGLEAKLRCYYLVRLSVLSEEANVI